MDRFKKSKNHKSSKKFHLKFTDDSNFKGNRKLDSNYYRRHIASKKISYLHALMENVEQLMIVSSFITPEIKPGLIDRFLILCHHFTKTPIIVFTKSDLIEIKLQQYYVDIYQHLYPTFVYSTVKGSKDVLKTIQAYLRGQATAIVGHSGVGKTSLLNQVDPSYQGMVSEISQFTKRGRHTTTRIKKYDFPKSLGGGMVFDMPGLKEIDFIDLNGKLLRQYYPEFTQYIFGCDYKNCSHTHEPICGVKEAVKTEKIHPIRYRNYITILETLSEL